MAADALKVTSLPSIFTVFVSAISLSSNHKNGQSLSPALNPYQPCPFFVTVTVYAVLTAPVLLAITVTVLVPLSQVASSPLV